MIRFLTKLTDIHLYTTDANKLQLHNNAVWL